MEYCSNCKYFDRYYTKEIKKFECTKIGWCCKAVTVVNANESCNKYKYRERKERSNWLLRQTLNDILTEISEVRMVIEAEPNEDEDG